MSLREPVTAGPDHLLLTVETLVNGGAGLARHDGQVIFIPYTAPGDLVRCRVTKKKKQFAEAEILELLRPGPIRRQPNCAVAGNCGGCQWQHLPYAEQLGWKETLYRETLIRQCGVDPQRILPIVAAPGEWNYRTRIQVKCRNTGAGFITGFFRRKSRYIVSIEQCPIIADELNRLLEHLRKHISSSPFADQIPQIDMAVDDYGKCAAIIHYFGFDLPAFSDFLLSANLGADLAIQSGPDKKSKLIRGDGILQISVDRPSKNLQYALGGFAQINLAQNRALVDTVVNLVNWRGDELVLDLYCGMGNFTLPLASRVRHVVGVEESPTSIKMARINAQQGRYDNIEFYCMPAEESLKRVTPWGTPDLLLLDPPRSGASAVMNAVATTSIDKIIYVSCDPQTLARDLRVLIRDGFDLVSSQPFDMFPQTHHCESVSLLQRHD